jgi:hypothetical protein
MPLQSSVCLGRSSTSLQTHSRRASHSSMHVGLVAAVLLAFLPSPGQAQTQQTPAAKAQSEARLAIPPAEVLLMLIRRTLLALHNANETGNYTVLRDLGALPFQRANTAARLAEIFQTQRKARTDLLPTLIATPKLTSTPGFTASNQLRLTGVFPTSPREVRFDLQFMVEDGHWRLFAIAVGFADTTRGGFLAEGARIGDESDTTARNGRRNAKAASAPPER